MAAKDRSARTDSKRQKNQAEMLEEALARPGVREVMKVYGGWREKERTLDSYRTASRTARRVTTTNRANS